MKKLTLVMAVVFSVVTANAFACGGDKKCTKECCKKECKSTAKVKAKAKTIKKAA